MGITVYCCCGGGDGDGDDPRGCCPERRPVTSSKGTPVKRPETYVRERIDEDHSFQWITDACSATVWPRP